jgi:hypothetical protein
VREKARQTSCLSNEKQLGLAFAQYTSDYDENFPCGTDFNLSWSTRWVQTAGWAGQIYPYVKSVNVFTCPDDPTKPSGFGSPISYGMNYHLSMIGSGSTLSGNARLSTPVSLLNSPASTVLLGEIHGNTADPTGHQAAPTGQEVESATIDCEDPPAQNDNVPDWTYQEWGMVMATGYTPYTNLATMGTTDVGVHTGGSNWLAADYHVKWLLPDKVSGGYYESAPGYQQTNKDHAAGTANMTNAIGGVYTLTVNPE